MILDWKRLKRLKILIQRPRLELRPESRMATERYFGGIWGNVNMACTLDDITERIHFLRSNAYNASLGTGPIPRSCRLIYL